MAHPRHLENVSRFRKIILTLTELGEKYVPVHDLISLSALRSKLIGAENVLTAVDTNDAAQNAANYERFEEFKSIAILTAKVKNAVELTSKNTSLNAALQNILDELNNLPIDNLLIDNSSATDFNEKLAANGILQRNYDYIIAHFTAIIKLLETREDYQPDNTEVKIENLQEKLINMSQTNNAAKMAEITAADAREDRNDILYNPQNGIIELVDLVKNHLLTTFGKENETYQNIAALEFKKAK
jgi:hypothetical protein